MNTQNNYPRDITEYDVSIRRKHMQILRELVITVIINDDDEEEKEF